MRPPGWFRLMRAGAFAGVCVVVSLVGHDLMASRPAPLWAGAVAVAGVAGVGYCLADRRRSLWWVLLAVEVTQVCLHEWFAWATAAGSASMRPPMAMHDGMHMGAASGTAAATRPGGGPGLGMVAAHALAGVLVALWLYAGERALWRMLGVLAGVVARRAFGVIVVLAGLIPVAGRSGILRRRRGEDEAPPGWVVLRYVVVRRGPPRGVDVAFGTSV